MSERTTQKVVIWPFLLMDLVFFGLAYALFHFAHRPLLLWEAYGIIACVALGAWTFLKPFQTKLRMAESENLISAAEEIKKIEHIASQIGSSTSLWHSIQEQAAKTAGTAKVISDQITNEAKAFSDFLQKANEAEKGHLRLEIDKLKQGEADWLETLVRVSDHIFALHQAATRSGQPRLVEQMSNFRNACFEVTRRVGLNAFAAAQNEPFDPARHQVADGSKPEDKAEIVETLACGYTFRGQLVRRAAVRLRVANPDATSDTVTLAATPAVPKKVAAAAPASATGELPL